jgi:hypothetical protein
MIRRKSPKLIRHPAKREPKRRITLFCEGKNTEPAYFEALRRQFSTVLVDLRVIGEAGVPFTIAEKAVKYLKDAGLGKKSRRKLSSYEENDQVWGVFDRDEHLRYQEAIARCLEAGVRVARSNPCFELWLILHERDYDKPSDRHEVQAFLQRLRPEYDRSKRKIPACDAILATIEQAECRAENLLRRREEEGDPFGPPSTTVFYLTREIRGITKTQSQPERRTRNRRIPNTM